MFVGIAVLDLHLPHARDLKSKRRVVKGLVDRLHARYRLSIAETSNQDLHQRAELGVAVPRGRVDVVHAVAQQHL